MSKVRYKYKAIATSLVPAKYDFMPIIPITICYRNNKLSVMALVDSGAVRCFCHVEVGVQLGISLDECERNSLKGLGGVVPTYIQEIEIDIEHGKYRFAANVDFGVFSFHGFSFILGQKDFFDNINVLFEGRKQRLELHFPR